MSSTSDKIKGAVNTAVGQAKQSAGHVAGDEKLEAKGAAQELKGRTQTAVGDVKSGVKKAADALAEKTREKL